MMRSADHGASVSATPRAWLLALVSAKTLPVTVTTCATTAPPTAWLDVPKKKLPLTLAAPLAYMAPPGCVGGVGKGAQLCSSAAQVTGSARQSDKQVQQRDYRGALGVLEFQRARTYRAEQLRKATFETATSPLTRRQPPSARSRGDPPTRTRLRRVRRRADTKRRRKPGVSADRVVHADGGSRLVAPLEVKQGPTARPSIVICAIGARRAES